MKVLIAPDSFKGSLSSKEICDITESAILSLDKNISIIKVPIADGGEGTVDSLVLNTNGEFVYKTVTDPLGGNVEAKFGILGDRKTAVIEMATASGITLVPREKRNPMFTTTYGTGELIKEALDLGCRKIIMGIGGSATNDGGSGMLQALGFTLLNNKGNTIKFGAKGLLDLSYIDIKNADNRLNQTKFIVACDVNNPLYGVNGASYIYGPQKGASEEMLPILDKALINFDKNIKLYLHKSVTDINGTGAAGGLGAGLLAFMNAELKSGFEIISKTIGLEELFELNNFDLVLTGEGEINYQTINGKLPIGIAKMAKKYNVPVIAVVGSIGEGIQKVFDEGIDSIISIIDKPMNLNEAMNKSEELLFNTILRLFRILLIKHKVTP